MENIRSYVSKEIVFPEGKVLLWGNIGCGKSSILLSIDFVLFGLQRSELAGASLLRNGTEEGSVELFFSIDDKNYILKRNLKRTKSGVAQDYGYIICEGIKQEKTALELKQAVLELLNYPKDLLNKNKSLIYRYTVYTPQEEMKTILLESKEERLDTLRKVFGVDKYKRIRENAKVVSNSLRELKKMYEGATADIQDKISMKENKDNEKLLFEEKIKIILPSLEESKKDIDKKKEELLIIEKGLEEANRVKTELSLVNQKIKHKAEEKLEKENLLNKTKKDIEDLEKETSEKKLPNIEENKQNIDHKKEALLAIEKGLEEANKIKTELSLIDQKILHKTEEKLEQENKLNKIKLEIEELEKEKLELNEDIKETIKDFDSRINNKEKELREILNKINEFRVRKTHSLQTRLKIESLNQCPTCLQEVCEGHKCKIISNVNREVEDFDKQTKENLEIANSIESEIKVLKEEIEILKKKDYEIGLIKLKIQNLNEKKKDYSGIIERLSLCEKEINESNIILEELNKRYLGYSTFEKKCEEIKEELEILKKKDYEIGLIKLKFQNLNLKKRDYLDIQERILLCEKEIKGGYLVLEELNKKYLEYSSFEGISLSIKEELDKKLVEFHKLDMERVTYEATINHLIKSIDELVIEINQKNLLREKKEYINKVQFWLNEHFVPMMEIMEKNVLYKVHEEFNGLFENWFSILMDNNVLQMSLDEEYSPRILQNGYDIEYEFLSGGEKTAGALAYRLALNQVINNMNTGLKTKDLLILDEPTDGFSSEQLNRLKVLMDEIKIPQIIIVSHEQEVESFVDHIIKLEKVGHETKLI